MGKLLRIYLRPSTRTPPRVVARATAVAGTGLEGDHAHGGKRQVTLISREAWDDAIGQLGGGELDPGARRANLLVEGIELGATIGKRLRVGPVELEVMGETRPCQLMDDARLGLKDALVLYALPIALWTLFGSLDILITAKGTFLNPYREGNQLARAVFIEAGYLGPVAASILWIALWAFIVFAINKLKMPNARFVSLCIFYSLSMGHLSGFSSWYAPFCQIARTVAWSKLPIIIGLGIIAACLHLAAQKAIDGGVGARKKN